MYGRKTSVGIRSGYQSKEKNSCLPPQYEQYDVALLFLGAHPRSPESNMLPLPGRREDKEGTRKNVIIDDILRKSDAMPNEKKREQGERWHLPCVSRHKKKRKVVFVDREQNSWAWLQGSLKNSRTIQKTNVYDSVQVTLQLLHQPRLRFRLPF